ncbi:hypothetical protein C8R46DRAFT_1037916 [Mycena filopes]|nr:hypothetical protein C8R46DRAFT_1037916 [Mycena filopes]
MVSVGLNNLGCLRTTRIEPRENNLWYETSWLKIITRAGGVRDGRLATNPGAGMLNRGKRVDVRLQPSHLVRGTQGYQGTACPTSQRTSASKSAVINHAAATRPFIYLRAGVEELSRSLNLQMLTFLESRDCEVGTRTRIKVMKEYKWIDCCRGKIQHEGGTAGSNPIRGEDTGNC